jgi:uncharacterized protein (TIGR02646 family)
LIRITKPAQGPAKLIEGAPLVAAHEAARLADATAGASRATAFKFEKAIYGASIVKTALRAAQHDKCCYCEGFFAGHASGDVEHFRPKTCFQQAKNAPMEYPGYYWLAYTWSNLYYACELCNRVGERNLFPLVDPSSRNRSGNDQNVEESEILDPGGPVDPREHIRFSDAAVEGITDTGRKTIRALGLDRGPLTTARLHHLRLLSALRDLADLPLQGLDAATLSKRQEAHDKLRQMAHPNAIYSAMAHDFLTS